MDAKPKRRWFRFSLRTLLVLATIACAGFGWLGVKMQQARRQQQAVEKLEKLGARVVYDYQIDPDRGWFMDSAVPTGSRLDSEVARRSFFRYSGYRLSSLLQSFR